MRTGRPRHGSTGTQLAASSAARKPPLPRDLRLRRRSPLLGSGCAGPSIIRSLHGFRLARAKGAISRMPRTNVQGPRPGDWKRQVTTKGPASAWRAVKRTGPPTRRLETPGDDQGTGERVAGYDRPLGPVLPKGLMRPV